MQDTTKTLLELINEFIKRYLALLYTNNELSEREIKKTIPFTITPKDLHLENYKTLMKEIEDDTNKKIYCAHGLDELVLLK